MNVSFIGSGNLAWHLGPALDNAGYVVKEVYSPNPRHAAALTERLYQAEIMDSLDFSTSHSGIFIIAVADKAIESVATEIVLPEDAILVHTSGSASLDLLQFAATPYTGIFYPLQTFTKHKKIDFKTVPV
ncbi:MAG TPA: NAD(P)-binding domain-containing protein, partial [Cyclobacteriaceae bacterium]|nr:NAD(P)-binding domain-containing protein [Cyclobacteriaceae bacterium]